MYYNEDYRKEDDVFRRLLDYNSQDNVWLREHQIEMYIGVAVLLAAQVITCVVYMRKAVK